MKLVWHVSYKQSVRALLSARIQQSNLSTTQQSCSYSCVQPKCILLLWILLSMVIFICMQNTSPSRDKSQQLHGKHSRLWSPSLVTAPLHFLNLSGSSNAAGAVPGIGGPEARASPRWASKAARRPSLFHALNRDQEPAQVTNWSMDSFLSFLQPQNFQILNIYSFKHAVVEIVFVFLF